jgi:hypothetical protein
MQHGTWMVVDMLGLDMLCHVVLLLAKVGADRAFVLTRRQPVCHTATLFLMYAEALRHEC